MIEHVPNGSGKGRERWIKVQSKDADKIDEVCRSAELRMVFPNPLDEGLLSLGYSRPARQGLSTIRRALVPAGADSPN
jgi:hypothetical protein